MPLADFVKKAAIASKNTISNENLPNISDAIITDPNIILRNELYDLIRKGTNNERVKEIINKNLGDLAKEANTSLLTYSAQFKNREIVKFLVEKGVDINAQIEHDATPLIKMLDDVQAMEILLENGANPNGQNKYGKTILSYIGKDSLELIELLFKYNVIITDEFISSIYRDDFVKIGNFLNQKIKNPKLTILSFKFEQLKFIDSLTPLEKETLRTYSYMGDGIINQVLRGNIQYNLEMRNNIFDNFKSINDRNQHTGRPTGTEWYDRNEELANQIRSIRLNPGSSVKESVSHYEKNNIGVIKKLVLSFLNVFKKVPLLNHELIVYRGVRRSEDIYEHGNDFLSTTYIKGVISDFINKDTNCCVLTITLKPGIRALYYEPLSKFKAEHEILIGPPYKVEKTKVSETEYNLVISPLPRYRNGGRRKTYRKKNKKRKTSKRRFIS